MIGIGTPSIQSRIERPMTYPPDRMCLPTRQMAGVELLVAVTAADAGSPPSGRGAENHRGGCQKGKKDSAFARGFGRRPHFVGGRFHLLGKRIDPLFGISLSKTRARRNDAY
jgi:hypothetical protein